MAPTYAPAPAAAALTSRCGENMPPLPLSSGRTPRVASPAFARIDRALNCPGRATLRGPRWDAPVTVVAAVALAAVAGVVGAAFGFAAAKHRAGHS